MLIFQMYIHITDILFFIFSYFFCTGQQSPYFLRGQMANMTTECGTASSFVTQATNSPMDGSWETLLTLNLPRYTRGGVHFRGRRGGAAKIPF